MKDQRRFLRYVERLGARDCWRWTGGTDRDGYGRFWFSGGMVSAHRWAYEQAKGPIPEGVEIDHRCLNEWCVNPRHLRLATRKQNGEHRRGATVASKSGIRGISYHPQRRKWRAVVTHDGKHIEGQFDTKDEAVEAVKIMRAAFFTHS